MQANCDDLREQSILPVNNSYLIGEISWKEKEKSKTEKTEATMNDVGSDRKKSEMNKKEQKAIVDKYEVVGMLSKMQKEKHFPMRGIEPRASRNSDFQTELVNESD